MKSSRFRGCWWSPYKRIGNVSVVAVDLTPSADRETQAMSWLSHAERLRWDRYEFAGPRRQFALSRAALRAMLCEEIGCRNQHLKFCVSDQGKPVALVGGIQSGISFNVSHSGRFGLVALAKEGRVGVDVEELVFRQDLASLSEAVFTADEQVDIAKATGEYRSRLFYDLWTMKEALLKALGTGLYMNPAHFEVPLPMRRGSHEGLFRFPDLPGVFWRLNNIGNEHFAASVAHEIHPHPPKTACRGPEH